MAHHKLPEAYFKLQVSLSLQKSDNIGFYTAIKCLCYITIIFIMCSALGIFSGNNLTHPKNMPVCDGYKITCIIQGQVALCGCSFLSCFIFLS